MLYKTRLKFSAARWLQDCIDKNHKAGDMIAEVVNWVGIADEEEVFENEEGQLLIETFTNHYQPVEASWCDEGVADEQIQRG
jgi:hypothetical protein